jgi:hypothetical protein
MDQASFSHRILARRDSRGSRGQGLEPFSFFFFDDVVLWRFDGGRIGRLGGLEGKPSACESLLGPGGWLGRGPDDLSTVSRVDVRV